MVELRPARCAICRTEGNAVQLYPASFKPEDLTPTSFSARRTPNRLHYRIVRCRKCGLVRSDPVASPELLQQLYTLSSFTYAAEVDDLRHTYGRHLSRLVQFGGCKGSLLEIGCGNGFFLEEALKQGFAAVSGVEPSREAVAVAAPSVRSSIRCDVFRPGLLPHTQFDVICLFQVLDHFPDPASVLRECLQLLRPGALLLAINHNADAISARLLGRLSPIIDIEHTYLYGLRTMRRLVSNCGFEVCRVAPMFNRFPLRYLARLCPVPARVKTHLLAFLDASRLARLRLSLPLGNLVLVARKPLQDQSHQESP